MSALLREKLAYQLRAYNDTVREMAKHKVYNEAQLRYEVVITPIDLKTAEPTFDGTSLHFYFNTRMYGYAAVVQKVPPTAEVEKYFYQREGVTFRVDLFIRLFAPAVSGEFLSNHQFSSAKLDAWDSTVIAVHNPDGNDDEAGDWQVKLEFKKPEGKKMSILHTLTVEHIPKHCNTLLDILVAEAIELETMYLLRVMKSAPIVAPDFHLEPVFKENGRSQLEYEPSVKRRTMAGAYPPSPGF